MSEPKTEPQQANPQDATNAVVSPPAGVDPKYRAYDPSVRTKDLTSAEKRARRQLRKQEAQELEVKRLRAEAAAAANVVEVAPIAPRAHMRTRHWGLVFSFILFVLIPLVVVFWYLETRAVDKYASTVAFTVQQEQATATTDLLSGMAAQVSGGASDTSILYEFIQSQQMVTAINEEFDLIGMYSEKYDQDPIFSLSEDATIEDLVKYWPRILKVSYDEAGRLLELRVLSFEPEQAQAIAQAIYVQSQTLINELNAQSRNDSIRYAQIDLTSAEERLSKARSDLILFRTRTQIVDPQTDLAGRLGVVNTLQQQLAEALVDYDILAQSTSLEDPRVVQAQRRIEVIRARLSEERSNVTQRQEEVSGEDYPTLLAEYEGLVVAREISEQMYRAALTALEVARTDAARQSRYLAAYIRPTLPQTAEFPQRGTMFGLAVLFVLLAWVIGVLIYYSVRDSR